MPIFKYRGYTSGGSESAGTVEADGMQDAVQKVKALGLYPRNVEPAAGTKGWSPFRRRDVRRIPSLTRELSVLLSSGVPLVESLRALSREAGGEWQALLVDVREKVVAGASLSRALEDYGGVFPEFYRNMVAAGEQSGKLDRVLERLADFLESQALMKDKVRTAMVYPLFMASVGVVVLGFLFAFVVPKIVRIFEDTQSALPLPTVILVGISNFFVHYWWALTLLVPALGYFGRKTVRKHREGVDRLLFRVFQSLYLSRFARTLSFLLEGGLPMLSSLELAGRTSGNLWLRNVVHRAEAKVSEGAGLAASLEGLSPVMLELIDTGERSGRMVDVLGKAADTYETEFDRQTQKALALLEPVMILLMGMVVGFIVFAVLLPMFQLNQVIR
jgi:general secretion pathway protein F